ncbi:E3 ubiquitin-protein ligase rnf146-like [Temnothorax americanus]|uniref:E3 ubiquitin-protein ligase rnf146-like n=1 Tax=Temnothorax americanus TaxID=1964332 RepID=UPI004067D862
MAQAKLDVSEKSGGGIKEKDKDSEEKEDPTVVSECAVCLHIYCYLCVKGVANQSKRCPMCRQEIPPDFLERPQLVEVEESQKESEHPKKEYQWFYEGRNGWWKYDPRTSNDLETIYKLWGRAMQTFDLWHALRN